MRETTLTGKTTGIGSLPYIDPDDALRLIINSIDIPFWPQLPRRSPLEGMVAQFSEGMPLLRLRDDGTPFIKRETNEELERFYESYTEDTKIAISEDHARGLHAFLSLSKKGRRWNIVKGHITGPLTFTLGIAKDDGSLIYFDEELRELSLMLLKAKVRWQIDELKSCGDSVIIFVDEPILGATGSGPYISVSANESQRLLLEIIKTIRERGAMAGIHSCGRADWSMVMKVEPDILSFDSYNHFNGMLPYSEELKEYLSRDNYLAWGAIPTTDAIKEEDIDSILLRFRYQVETLSRFISFELIKNRILLTPSCGMGSRNTDETHKVIQLLIRLKEEGLK